METRAVPPSDPQVGSAPLVQFFPGQWVGGMRAVSYHGPVKSTRHCSAMELEWALQAVEVDLSEEITRRGGNWGVGIEITVDPFQHEGYAVCAECTSARLEKLF